MSVFKVVARDPKTGRQTKKKIYIGETYSRYSEELIKRWQEYNDIEIYLLQLDDTWKLWYKIAKPSTEEEVKKHQLKCGYADSWYEYYIKNNL